MSRFSQIVALALVAQGAAAQDLKTAGEEELMILRPASLDMSEAKRTYNLEAPVPPQCYTKIEGKFNPCYVCHQTYDDAERPNYMDDGALQEAYDFSDAGMVNHWRNLFIDRSAEVAAISDEEIIAYINENNYSDLAPRLKVRDWKGWVPDLADYHKGAEAFDETGFALDGTGWVAFNYKPQPSTFWPSNGSTDDVLIRLPAPFRSVDGVPARDVYMANLALVEMAFQDLDETTVPAIDEAVVGVDLDGDGTLGMTERVQRQAHYLGDAADYPVNRMRYPEGTEFLHSVRYVGVEGENITTPHRMKELRYMRKTVDFGLPEIRTLYDNEHQEKIDENLPRYIDVGDLGMDTGYGWLMLGFIEDANGDLRPQTNEEQFFCKGCHSTMGGNIDQTWAFPRKVTGAEGWGYIDYRALSDAPNIGQEAGEILTYLQRVGGADEFRSNQEALDKWFNADGSVKIEEVQAASVYDLIMPSPERALELNKAYRVIVGEQTFLFGRDATVRPPINVHSEIDGATAPTLPPEKRFAHDIRLRWDR